MPLHATYLFLFSFLASAALVGTTLFLKKRYLANYLELYSQFLLITCVYGLINWTGPFLILAVSDAVQLRDPMWTLALFVLFAVPFSLLKLGLFITLLLRLRSTRLPGWLLQGLLIGSSLAVLAVLLAVKTYFDSGDIETLRLFILVFGALLVAAELGALGHFIWAARQTGSAIPVIAMPWAWIYLVSHIIYVAAAYSPGLGMPAWVVATAPYLYFLMHAGPLALIAQQLVITGAQRLSLDQAEGNLSKRYGLTPREEEILQQISRGHSNAEIGTALFISPNTVRNHVYSIYQKTGVKNRIQLAAILTAQAGDENEGGA